MAARNRQPNSLRRSATRAAGRASYASSPLSYAAIPSMSSAMGNAGGDLTPAVTLSHFDGSNARRLLAADGWYSICAIAEGEGAPLNKSHLGSARGRMHLPKWVRFGRTNDERLLHVSDLQSLVTVGTTAGRFVPNPAKASRSATAGGTGPRWPLA